MSHPLFDQHRKTLDGALAAIRSRAYWTPYPEMPSPKIYGETAQADGQAAFAACVGADFALAQAGQSGWLATERSPYGVRLDVRYPRCDANALVAAARAAMPAWRKIGPDGRAGVCLEILARLNRQSFEIATAVMMTTGQGWMMAFQAGGPHAQDRGLEAVAYGYQAQAEVPAAARWEKPQGKNPPLVMEKRYEIVGRGVALVIGCATFPTWNTYPGLFAALVTGNPVIVKPHPNAVLPAAITVRTARAVLAEAGLDPNLVSLLVTDRDADTQALAQHPAVQSIDFTGGNAFGAWLKTNCPQAQLYAEQAGVNNVVVESTDDYKGLLRNLAFTLALYSGQMCTTTQAILVPGDGLGTPDGRVGFDQFAGDLGRALDKLLADPAVATAVLGALNSPAVLQRIEAAPGWGQVVVPSRQIAHPDFPGAIVRTPILLSCNAADSAWREERFGPIAFVVRCADAAAAVMLSESLVRSAGAMTVGLYSTDAAVIEAMTEATLNAQVALSINLTGSVYVNQSAAFSDFHGTGGNPAANASYADAAFVANRFRVIQRRWHASADPAAAA